MMKDKGSEAHCSDQEYISLHGRNKTKSDADVGNDIFGSERFSFLKELKCNHDTQNKAVLSVFVSLAFTVLGWTKGQLGPAFLDLMILSGTDLQKGSSFLTSYFLGRVVGCFVGGILHKKIDKFLVLAISLTINALAFVAIPWCFIFQLMIALHVLLGLTGGVMSVVITSAAVTIWGATDRGRSYLHIHFASYSIAGLLSPMITSPFLLPTDYTNYNENVLNTSSINSQSVTLNSSEYTTTKFHLNFTSNSQNSSRLYIPYTVSGTIALLAAVPLLVLSFKANAKPKNEASTTKDCPHVNLSFAFKILHLINLAFLAAVFLSIDYIFTGYLPLFCMEHLKWTKHAGSTAVSISFCATLSGRILSSSIVRYVKPITYLIFSAFFFTGGFAFLTVSAHIHNNICVWVSFVIISIPLGTIWPTLLTCVNEYLFKIDNKMSGFILGTAFVGPLLSPLLFGYMMEEKSPIWFCYLCLVKSCTIIVYVLIIFSRTTYVQKLQKEIIV